MENNFKHHKTIVKEVEDIDIKPCSSCCPLAEELYHCPFCNDKSTYRSRLVSHLKLHIGRGIKYGEWKIIECQCLASKTKNVNFKTHFHCPFCTEIGTSRTWNKDHIAACHKHYKGKKTTSAHSEKEKTVDKLESPIKPGRPPKKKSEKSNASYSDEKTASVVASKLKSANEITPRKRGRPPKISSAEIINEHDEEDSKAMAMPKSNCLEDKNTPKKRGRPSKNSPAHSANVEDSEEMVTPVSNCLDENNAEKKKGRGRPKKSSIHKTGDDTNSIVSTTVKEENCNKEHATTLTINSSNKSKFQMTASITIGNEIFPEGVCDPVEIIRTSCEGLQIICVEENNGFVLSGAWEQVSQAKELLETLIEAIESTISLETSSENLGANDEALTEQTKIKIEEEEKDDNGHEDMIHKSLCEAESLAEDISDDSTLFSVQNLVPKRSGRIRKPKALYDDCDSGNEEQFAKQEIDDCSIQKVLVVKKKKKNDQPSKRVTIRAPELANFTCEICGYQSTLEGVRKHRVREHSTKHVYCEICDSPFSSRYEMRKHRKKHFYLDGTQTEELKTLSESKPELKNIMLQDVEIKYPKLLPFKCIPFSDDEKPKLKKPRLQWLSSCKVCQLIVSIEALPDHWKSHYNDIYRCDMCNKMFEKSDTHVCTMNSEKTSSLIKCCPFCDYTHESENNIRGHAESHSAVFSCVMCDVETCKPDDLQNHYKKTHMKLLKQLPREEPTEHSCSFCARVFKKQAQLTLHLRIHKQREIVGCPNCDYKGPKNKMKAHALKYHHPTKYVCEICGKDFGSVGAAKFHMTSVHEGTLYSCPVCDKKFSTDRFRKVHMKRVHQKQKKHFCSVCNKGFFELFRKKEHEKLAHISDAMKEKHKKYACSYCEKRFLKKMALSQHENTHTGAKPYRCSMCDKGFSYCSEVRKHEISHSNAKPYRCTQCGKGFKFPFKLKAHMIIHTKVGPHSCKKCGKVFTALATLRKHACKARKQEMTSAIFDAEKEGVTYCVTCETISKPGGEQNCCRNPQLVQAIVMEDTPDANDSAELTNEENSMEMCVSDEKPDYVNKPVISDLDMQLKSEDSVAEATYMCGVCNSLFDSMYLVNKHIAEHKCNEIIKRNLVEGEENTLTAQNLLSSMIGDHANDDNCTIDNNGQLLPTLQIKATDIDEQSVKETESTLVYTEKHYVDDIGDNDVALRLVPAESPTEIQVHNVHIQHW